MTCWMRPSTRPWEAAEADRPAIWERSLAPMLVALGLPVQDEGSDHPTLVLPTLVGRVPSMQLSGQQVSRRVSNPIRSVQIIPKTERFNLGEPTAITSPRQVEGSRRESLSEMTRVDTYTRMTRLRIEGPISTLRTDSTMTIRVESDTQRDLWHNSKWPLFSAKATLPLAASVFVTSVTWRSSYQGVRDGELARCMDGLLPRALATLSGTLGMTPFLLILDQCLQGDTRISRYFGIWKRLRLRDAPAFPRRWPEVTISNGVEMRSGTLAELSTQEMSWVVDFQEREPHGAVLLMLPQAMDVDESHILEWLVAAFPADGLSQDVIDWASLVNAVVRRKGMIIRRCNDYAHYRLDMDIFGPETLADSVDSGIRTSIECA